MSDHDKGDDEATLKISAAKYSTVVDFEENMEREDSELDEKEKEEVKEEEEQKQNVLNHWSKLLVKEPPKRRTCHTSFIYDSFLYVIGGIDITEKKQDDIYKVNIKEPNSSWEIRDWKALRPPSSVITVLWTLSRMHQASRSLPRYRATGPS